MAIKATIVIFLIFAGVEIFLYLLVNYLRRDFQWLITYKDDLPDIDKDRLAKFLKQSYDSELGWIRKPNTQGVETVKSVGQTNDNKKQTSFTINSRGARYNPGHENLPEIISCYGDSFAFCRHVDDNETWEWHLSALTNSNVLNFGVGNYGVDQALLRMKREFNKYRTKIVILCVVPETITRIINIWKHYSEYGNVLGFKPRFVVNNNRLNKIDNFISSESSFKRLKNIIKEIQDHDLCYKNKFTKDMLKFPFTVNILKNYERNVLLINSLIISEIIKKFRIKSKLSSIPWEIVLKRNSDFCIDLYNNHEATELFIKIINEFKVFSKLKDFIPVFVLMPYKSDIKKKCYYEPVMKQIRSRALTIDLAEHLLTESNINKYYINDFYGGHLNKDGNRFVARIIHEKITSSGLLSI
jgi:hypothetical protein